MKTILVPIDFSDNSKNAMDYAISLANKLKMKLLLLHAFQATLAEAVSDSYKMARHKQVDGSPEEMKKELDIWQEAVRSSEENLKCDAIFTEDDLTSEISRLVKGNRVGLIVMGTKGVTGLKEVFIGSNTMRVIETVSCPVIAVPSEYQFKKINKIVFATDYHDSDIASIRFMVKLALLFDSELDIIHLADGELKMKHEKDLLEHFMEQVVKSVSYDKMKFQLLKGKGLNESLNQFIREQNADLLAVSMRDRVLKGPIFNQGITRKLANHIQIPLLTFRAFDFNESTLF